MLNVTGNAFIDGAVSGAASSALSQGLDMAAGLQKSFDWVGMAAAGVGSGVMAGVGHDIGLNAPGNTDMQNYALATITGAAGAIANAATRSLINGSDFGDNIIRALPDTIGSTIGSEIGNEMAQPDFGPAYAARMSDIGNQPFDAAAHGINTQLQPMDIPQTAFDPSQLDAPTLPTIRYTAQPGDSVSTMMGSSDPTAVGTFMLANGLTTSGVTAGQDYILPGADIAGAAAIGQAALNADNARVNAIDNAEINGTMGQLDQSEALFNQNMSNLNQQPEAPSFMSYATLDGCTTSNSITTCASSNFVVSFPSQPGFVDFTSGSPGYHSYNIPVQTPGVSLATDQQWIINDPTPGYPSPATAQGTYNDATPGIGGLSPYNFSPVESFITKNQLNGEPVVVNVTESGHPLDWGIVVREADSTPTGAMINNWGIGTSPYQAPNTSKGYFANDINNVWKGNHP